MAGQICKCTHEKRDHRVVTAAVRGACSICLCDSFITNTPRPPRVIEPVIEDSVPSRPIRSTWNIG